MAIEYDHRSTPNANICIRIELIYLELVGRYFITTWLVSNVTFNLTLFYGYISVYIINKFDRIISIYSRLFIHDKTRLSQSQKRVYCWKIWSFFFFPFFFQNPPKYCGATRTFRNFLALDCLSVCPSSLLGSLLSKVVG